MRIGLAICDVWGICGVVNRDCGGRTGVLGALLAHLTGGPGRGDEVPIWWVNVTGLRRELFW